MERLNYCEPLKYYVGRLTGAGILAIALTVATSDNAFAQAPPPFPGGGVRGDFNGDGYADLAIGVPFEDFQGQADAGVIHVVYGSNAGLQATSLRGGPPAAQLWSQASPGVSGGPEPHDRFGSALAVGDFNGDGFADLAIGVPFEDFQGQTNSGVVHILYGSTAGLQATGVAGPTAQLWSQASAGVASEPEPDDHFGGKLSVNDFNGDGFADLAIGVTLEDFTSQCDYWGAVQVLYGSSAGLQATGVGGPAAQLWWQASPGVADEPERWDVFGSRLASGDFNGDSFADLAIGASGEDVQGQDSAGVVHILYGSEAGLHATGVGGPAAQLWSQASPGLGAVPESFDSFGDALAVADFNGDGFADLAIGTGGEDFPGQNWAGVVHVLYGSNIGLQAMGYFGPGAQTWSQSTPGVLDEPEQFDIFGASLAAGDFDGDGFPDLAIGAPGENNGAGVVHILRGSNVGLHALAIGVVSLLWSQGSAGVAGGPEAGDYFGSALAIGDFNGDGFADLVIGARGEDLGQVRAGVVHTLYGSNAGLQASGLGGPPAQLWSQADLGGADGPEADDFFGDAVGGQW
jgi:hypothetical protein